MCTCRLLHDCSSTPITMCIVSILHLHLAHQCAVLLKYTHVASQLLVDTVCAVEINNYMYLATPCKSRTRSLPICAQSRNYREGGGKFPARLASSVTRTTKVR